MTLSDPRKLKVDHSASMSSLEASTLRTQTRAHHLPPLASHPRPTQECGIHEESLANTWSRSSKLNIVIYWWNAATKDEWKGKYPPFSRHILQIFDYCGHCWSEVEEKKTGKSFVCASSMILVRRAVEEVKSCLESTRNWEEREEFSVHRKLENGKYLLE